MPALLIPWLIRGAMVLAVVAALYGLWYSADHWCNAACVKSTVRADELQARVQEAQDRATALALLWAKSIEQVEVVYREKLVERESRFSALRERAANAGSRDYSGTIRVSPAGADILRDATNTANAQSSAPAAVDNGPAKTVPTATDSVEVDGQRFAESWILAAEAYADAVGKLTGCIAAYNSLRVEP